MPVIASARTRAVARMVFTGIPPGSFPVLMPGW
jgi:hypothetical protein